MAKYAAEMNRTAHATLGVGDIEADATTPRRQKLYDLFLGSEATPADNAFLWVVDKVTAPGLEAGSTVTPTALDPADAAALADVLENLTTNPTVGARYISIPLNQRATFRWVAAPGSELIAPASADNGFIILTPTQSAVAVTATALFEEQ